MLPFLPPLLAAFVLAAAPFLVSYRVPLAGLRLDIMAVFLLVFSLVNLRLALRLAARTSHAGGARTPVWVWLVTLLLAALITTQMVRAIHA